jgi:guanosine-3',5'-bis(diphosphate) 3'-pyrophosphohydrolase
VVENKPQDKIENEQLQGLLRHIKAKDSDIAYW